MIRRRLFVTGRVQNVFYRDWFADRAPLLWIDGVVAHDDVTYEIPMGFEKRSTE